jgi:ketosteroid isomerase-like protein
MRHVLIVVAALSALSAACAGGPPPPTAARPSDAKADEKEISRVLDDWHEGAARAEEARYFNHFAPGAVFLGTDASERWSLEDFRHWAHPKFSAGKAWTFKVRRRAVNVARTGDFAWFDEDLDTKNMGPARGTGVMVRGGSDGHWRIIQYALALTVPNDKLKDVKKLLATDGE